MTSLSGSRVVPMVIRCCFALIFAVSAALGQSQIIAPQSQPVTAQPLPSPVVPAKPQHVATLRSTDSSDGSRVALTSDQSLRDYEAYRRGDRFYIRIPAADIPRAEAVRGRAFADVRSQRTGDSTLVSFRLQPGATAHVEERSNRLDIVITLPGATATATPAVAASNTAANPGNTPEREKGLLARLSGTARNTAAPTVRNQSGLTLTPTPGASPRPAATATVMPAQKPAASPIAANQTGNPTQPQASQSGWASFKGRLHYWVLLAQLNPIPVSIVVGIVLLLIGMFFYQRRGNIRQGVPPKEAKATSADSRIPTDDVVTVAPVNAEESNGESSGLAPAAGDAEAASSEAAHDSARSLRIHAVTNEVEKALIGETYDQSMIASPAPETRQMVSTELLSALVGRNAVRRERAKAAFMKHGYFDDATRDLRVSESPNERAAAARRLSFVRHRDAAPHLIAALDDSSADVRRAAVEALLDLRDPSAIAALNSLMQTETDRRVPRNLIKRAIEACATSTPESSAIPESANVAAPVITQSTYRPDMEREVFEL